MVIRSQSLRTLTIPSLISLNTRSLLNKIDNMRSLLLSRLYHDTEVTLVQESWLNNAIDSELINFAILFAFCGDRPNSKRVESAE